MSYKRIVQLVISLITFIACYYFAGRIYDAIMAKVEEIQGDAEEANSGSDDKEAPEYSETLTDLSEKIKEQGVPGNGKNLSPKQPDKQKTKVKP